MSPKSAMAIFIFLVAKAVEKYPVVKRLTKEMGDPT